ncbi:unnamed protein product [Symbiodinium natans]|uniref:Uncharacterized protein n=1 Tax=Symbiodinium natans TaxID=878477 RepID=A0A812SIV6_9DINO|nr:unnamed protein product [Symbiodinium natans]
MSCPVRGLACLAHALIFCPALRASSWCTEGPPHMSRPRQASQSTLEISREAGHDFKEAEELPVAERPAEAACAEFAGNLEDSAVLPSAAEASPKSQDQDDGFDKELGMSPQNGEGSSCKLIGEDPVSKLRDGDTHDNCAMNLTWESSDFPCEESILKARAPTQVGEFDGCWACMTWLRKSLCGLALAAKSSQDDSNEGDGGVWTGRT